MNRVKNDLNIEQWNNWKLIQNLVNPNHNSNNAWNKLLLKTQ